MALIIPIITSMIGDNLFFQSTVKKVNMVFPYSGDNFVLTLLLI